MANKHQVLELLAKGLNPQQIAKKLKCSDAYVRATRRRDQVPKYTMQFPGYERRLEQLRKKYRNDPAFQKQAKARVNNYRQRQKALRPHSDRSRAVG